MAQGFDRWLDQQLREHHASVTAESLPDALTQAADQLDSRAAGASTAGDPGGNDDTS